MAINVLYLTHTDINSDSRILKEMQCISNMGDKYKVSGIGVIQEEGASRADNLEGLDIHSIVLRTREWRFLPRVLRHTCSLVELTVKMFYKAVKLKPSVVHCNDTLVLPLGVMIKLFLATKLIYDAHELESNRNGLTKMLGKMTLFTEKILWRFVDALIVVSPSIQKWYMQNMGEKYSEVILNSPVLEQNVSTVDGSYLREYFSIPNASKIFLYVGILGRGRGIELVNEVFTKGDVSSHLVFLGYGELKESLIELSNKHFNIHVHDAVPHDKVVTVAKSADVGICLIQNVSLSDYYCLPNKLFEYCFSEIPVLASNFPDISTVVNQYGLGKCCELDSDSIYHAIKAFEEMDTLPKINTDALYELSWEAQEKKLVKLYEQLI
ncbi:MAG: glycosyltransferase [Sulfurovum sp.]